MGSDKNPHAGHRKRMRERYAQNGFSGWAEHEVLEFILFDKIPRKDTNELAHNILNKFGSIENVLKAPVEELIKIEGIGTKTAEYIHTQEKIYNFCKLKKKSGSMTVYRQDRAQEYFMPLFEDINKEVFYMLSLDAQDRIIRCDLIFEGSFESIDVDIGSMVKTALNAEAKRVVFAHNHPSGVMEPSDSDITATNVIMTAMHLFGIEVKAHIIVTEEGCMDMISSCKI